ncbi:MAG: homocysteine S-methyltransferase family protein [Solirubrobacteraceae bacterium]
MASFADLLERRGVLMADGATATNYQDLGIEPGVAPEEWVFDAPENVGGLHRRFAEAGSDLVLTCTFGASPVRLEDGRLAGRAAELNTRAAEIARKAVSDSVLVAGSMGPTGQLVEPLGPLTRDACLDAFREQARALLAGGVDLLVLETFFALDEALWAAEAAREVSDLPLVMLFSFDQGTRTMMGLSPTQVVDATASLSLAAVGANCGRSLADTGKIVAEFVDAEVAVPLWVKPNAGVPQVIGGRVEYPEDPDSFSAQVAQFAARGARIVGGCCGSTPHHLAALDRALGR